MMVAEQDRKEALLHAMADVYTRKILFSTVSQAKSVEEIARNSGVPLSTCYRRVRELISLKLLRVERTIITDEGKKFESYRSVVKDAVLSLQPSGEFSVEVNLIHREPDERLVTMWNSVAKNKIQIIAN
jgi:hypothetical protein